MHGMLGVNEVQCGFEERLVRGRVDPQFLGYTVLLSDYMHKESVAIGYMMSFGAHARENLTEFLAIKVQPFARGILQFLSL